jgi:hypothetical protein
MMNAMMQTHGLNFGAGFSAARFKVPAGLALPVLRGLKCELFFLPPAGFCLTAAEEFDLANVVPPHFVDLRQGNEKTPYLPIIYLIIILHCGAICKRKF